MEVKTSQYRIRPLPLPPPWDDFLENIPAEEQWTMLVYGNSHSGKSSFALLFGHILSKYGDIFLANTEEDLPGGTIQTKARQNNVDIRKFDFLDKKPGFDFDKNISAIRKKLQHKNYKYCIIDSISAFAMTKNEILEVLNTAIEFPKTSFIFITHLTKDEKSFAGAALLKYMVDISIELKNGVADCLPKNRYKVTKSNYTLNFFKL